MLRSVEADFLRPILTRVSRTLQANKEAEARRQLETEILQQRRAQENQPDYEGDLQTEQQRINQKSAAHCAA
jgi:hypothetical protein